MYPERDSFYAATAASDQIRSYALFYVTELVLSPIDRSLIVLLHKYSARENYTTGRVEHLTSGEQLFVNWKGGGKREFMCLSAKKHY